MRDYEKTYKRKRKVNIDEVLSLIGEFEVVDLYEERIKLKSVRYLTFKNSTVCCKCGLIGSYFWMEKHRH